MKLKEKGYLQFLEPSSRRISLSVLITVFFITNAISQVRTYRSNYAVDGPAMRIPYNDLFHLNDDSTCTFVRIRNFEEQYEDTIRYNGTWSRSGNSIFLNLTAERGDYREFNMCLERKRRRLYSVGCGKYRSIRSNYFFKEVHSK